MWSKKYNKYYFVAFLRCLLIHNSKGLNYARGRESSLLDSGWYHGWY
jgi:hypothetical protein